MRVSKDPVNTYLSAQIKKTFAQLIMDIKNNDEASFFLKDFFTDSEYETFSKRLAIAYFLHKGRSYTNIKDNLKVSSATVAQVSEMMKTKGFQLALKKMEADEWAQQWSERIKKFVRSKK